MDNKPKKRKREIKRRFIFDGEVGIKVNVSCGRES